MPALQVLALSGLALFVAVALNTGRRPIRAWGAPAALATVFLGYSLWPIVTMGPLGFWPEHVSDPWSVQIWFDLLGAAGVGWAVLAPRARTAGISPWPWLVLILALGSIGLLTMLARVLHREARQGANA
jgi:hypothetical protein